MLFPPGCLGRGTSSPRVRRPTGRVLPTSPGSCSGFAHQLERKQRENEWTMLRFMKTRIKIQYLCWPSPFWQKLCRPLINKQEKWEKWILATQRRISDSADTPEAPEFAQASGRRWRNTSPRRPPMAKLRSCFSFWHPTGKKKPFLVSSDLFSCL